LKLHLHHYSKIKSQRETQSKPHVTQQLFQSLYLNKLDIRFLALEEILAGEPGSILIQVGQNLGLNRA
jgi:hypothetical protein